MKKYVPRSIQNIFDRIEAYNESITDVLFSEPLAKTFEVTVYTSLSPAETKTPAENDDDSTSVSNYYFYSARSKAGHHDHLVFPEQARTRDEYERFRNAHFQAIIKKSAPQSPQQGDVWLATLNGGNLVTLVSFQRSGTITTKFRTDGPARGAHSSGDEPTSSVGDYSEMSIEVVNMMNKNKKSRDILKSQLKEKFEAAGITFHVTSEVRNIDKQVSVLKKMYINSGRDEVLHKYGKKTTGKEIVQAIESGDELALRVAAQKSTRHLRGLAMDIRTKNLTDEQVNKAINIIRGLGLTYILENMKTGCWDKPGKNVTNVKRLAPPGGAKGEPCYAEHIHISIPDGYGL